MSRNIKRITAAHAMEVYKLHLQAHAKRKKINYVGGNLRPIMDGSRPSIRNSKAAGSNK